MELQALRYAAMVRHDLRPAVATLARIAAGLRGTGGDAGHLGWAGPDEVLRAGTRIILAAADFGKEITTTVLWLRDALRGRYAASAFARIGLEDGRVLLDIQTLIPLPEAETFQTRIGAKQRRSRRNAANASVLVRFWTSSHRGQRRRAASRAQSERTGADLGDRVEAGSA